MTVNLSWILLCHVKPGQGARIIAPRKVVPWEIVPQIIASQNLPLRIIAPLRKTVSRIIAPGEWI